MTVKPRNAAKRAAGRTVRELAGEIRWRVGRVARDVAALAGGNERRLVTLGHEVERLGTAEKRLTKASAGSGLIFL